MDNIQNAMIWLGLQGPAVEYACLGAIALSFAILAAVIWAAEAANARDWEA